VNFEYTAFQPFVGIVSFEHEEKTLGMGAYEDDCHLTPKKLPFGFGDFNLPSMDEVTGKHSSTSMTWVNEEHGTSSKEVTMLDEIEIEEKKEDGEVDEIESSAHVVNIDFDTTIIVSQPIIVNQSEPAEGEVFYFPPADVAAANASAIATEDSAMFKQMMS